jgi:dTDP-4-dehydrorhamnose 3,5-epimerase-like enzyme
MISQVPYFVDSNSCQDFRGSICITKLFMSQRSVEHLCVRNKTWGTWRGFHFQYPRMQQKYIRVNSGRLRDYCLDMNPESSTYCQVISLMIDSYSGWYYIPEWYAHAYYTLENSTTVEYLVLGAYEYSDRKIIRLDDPALDFERPGTINAISDSDRNAVDYTFTYER